MPLAPAPDTFPPTPGIAAAAQGELAGADARTIFTRAGQGDEQAQQLIHLSARTLARLIADIKATTDCQCVVVGGSVGLAEGYLALVEMYLAQEPAAFHVDLLAAWAVWIGKRMPDVPRQTARAGKQFAAAHYTAADASGNGDKHHLGYIAFQRLILRPCCSRLISAVLNLPPR